MRTKSLLLFVFMFFIGLSAFAQDKIIKKNGEVIEAKVSTINQDNIIFKRFDNLEGPEYSIPKADVARIKYPNGTEDIFEDDNDKIGVKRKDADKGGNGHYAKDERRVLQNIVSLIPIAITDGVGVGASIERVLDTKGVVNFYMPVMATFQSQENSIGSGTNTSGMVYFMPGIKMYTNLNTRKKMKFSIGPSFIIGAGNGNSTQQIYDPTTGYYISEYGTQSRFLLGAMANIGFNFFPTKHFYMGIDYGLGFTFINDYSGTDQGHTAVELLDLKVGYRF